MELGPEDNQERGVADRFKNMGTVGHIQKLQAHHKVPRV